jgi:hypothetical protein
MGLRAPALDTDCASDLADSDGAGQPAPTLSVAALVSARFRKNFLESFHFGDLSIPNR